MNNIYRLYTIYFTFFFFLSTCHFCFSRRFILTVTAFTVLFTAWYRPNCIFTYSCYHLKNNNLLVYQLLRLTPALLCCTAPRTARWIWRSINKIIIIIIIIIKPVKCPPRRFPIAMQIKLRFELDGLANLKVITLVTKPTEWFSQISVQTKKNGRLRICIDPRPLNAVIQWETYPLPTIDDLLLELANAKVFSKVDLSNGYWHCELDEASSLLTTFVTPCGRYRWLRLPLGTKVSSENFQRKLNESLEGLKGVVCVADDNLIFRISDADHDENLRNLLIRCREHNININKDKYVFKTAELDFLVHVVTNTVEAILQMPNPTDVEAVRRLQGMITYLAKFLPQLSSVKEPIRRLTRQDSEGEWAQEQETSMAELMKLVASVPLLAYYDPSN